MSEAAAEGRGRVEQRREKGEAAAEGKGRGRGREKSSGGEEREAAVETERLIDWAPALGDSAAVGRDFCS
jgi:hypothetical protein